MLREPKIVCTVLLLKRLSANATTDEDPHPSAQEADANCTTYASEEKLKEAAAMRYKQMIDRMRVRTIPQSSATMLPLILSHFLAIITRETFPAERLAKTREILPKEGSAFSSAKPQSQDPKSARHQHGPSPFPQSWATHFLCCAARNHRHSAKT